MQSQSQSQSRTQSDDNNISRSRSRAESVHIVELFEITIPDGRGSTEVMRLTGHGKTAIGFGGEDYTVIPLEATGFAWVNNSGGKTNPARPELRIGNRGGIFARHLARPYMVGGVVRRIVTMLEECDAPLGNGTGDCFTPETWAIERMTRLGSEDVTLTLKPQASLDGKSLPLRVMLKDLCQHRYRVWDSAKGAFDYTGVTCPYIGARSFDANGNPAADNADDRCSLRLESGCKKRFARTLPYLGFPGMGEF